MLWDGSGKVVGVSGLAGVCCWHPGRAGVAALAVCSRQPDHPPCVCSLCRDKPDPERGLVSAPIVLFNYSLSYPCFSSLSLLTAPISRYNRVFFHRTPGFHLILVRQLFLPLIFAVSLSKMTICISPSHLHGWKIRDAAWKTRDVACECFHPADSPAEQSRRQLLGRDAIKSLCHVLPLIIFVPCKMASWRVREGIFWSGCLLTVHFPCLGEARKLSCGEPCARRSRSCWRRVSLCLVQFVVL